jgi:16S rRNA (cytosine967-C5)-methyltransferase
VKQFNFKTRSKRPVESPRLAPDSLAFAIQQSAELIAGVLQGRNLTESWEAILALHPLWPAATRGAVRDMAWSTLREYGAGDLVLDQLLSKPLPDPVQRPEQSHVIVDQAVDAAAAFAPGLRGVVNGVLRNYLRQAKAFHQAIAANPVAHFHHPDWWMLRLQRSLPDVWQGVLEAGNTHPPMCLRVNRRSASRREYRRELQDAGMVAIPLGEEGLLLEQPVGVNELPGFAEGKVSVQDAGAQRAAYLLGVRDGERVLDACSAPGGKAAHILERADVQLTALDADPRRLARVRVNLDRLGLQARTVCGDARDIRQWWDGKPFDRILADVPCSASGVVRRHPDIKWLRRDEDICSFAAQQAAILDALWPSLARGGTMLYATCSVFEEENGAQVAAFCDRHPDVERLPLDGRMDLQLLPNAEHDGFYYALLRKSA